MCGVCVVRRRGQWFGQGTTVCGVGCELASVNQRIHKPHLPPPHSPPPPPTTTMNNPHTLKTKWKIPKHLEHLANHWDLGPSDATPEEVRLALSLPS